MYANSLTNNIYFFIEVSEGDGQEEGEGWRGVDALYWEHWHVNRDIPHLKEWDPWNLRGSVDYPTLKDRSDTEREEEEVNKNNNNNSYAPVTQIGSFVGTLFILHYLVLWLRLA